MSEESLVRPSRRVSVLVVDDDELIRDLVSSTLEDKGYDVVTAEDGEQALARVAEAIPDLIASDIEMPNLDGLGFVDRLRADLRTRAIPLIFLTTRGKAADIVAGLHLGADDYVVKPFVPEELAARVEVKLARRPVPIDMLTSDLQTGVLRRRAWLVEATREVERGIRAGRVGWLAVLSLDETSRIRETLGSRALDELARQIGEAIAGWSSALDIVGRDEEGRFLLVLPETPADVIAGRLDELGRVLAGTSFRAGGESVRITSLIGYAGFGLPSPHENRVEVPILLERALTAESHAAAHLDLRAARWTQGMAALPRRSNIRASLNRLEPLRLPVQIMVSWLIGLAAPFLVYMVLDRLGFDVTPLIYMVVVVALLVTGTSIWLEGLAALRAPKPPEEPASPYPKASAIIAAYMPNEASTILETLDAFLRLDYPADLQVIVAYNTPVDMPIEAELAALAEREPRITPFRVRGSTSKAQNVNAALPMVTGEFVGVFDADHQPKPDSFKRAWRWLSNGWDVVQGHCLVRNGEASAVARLIAVEFETIYSVSHPGRAAIHGFGIFGGSNGYWRTDLLAQTRMRGSMLTEDIDSSLRVIEAGGKIASDPGLVSRELGPATLKALWNQRMRWAQGWFQVSMIHMKLGFRSPHLSLRNKIGLFYLLGWREIYPWLSLQMFPVIAFFAMKAQGARNLDWFVPIFVLTTLFTLSVGPWQTLFSYRLADPEIRARKRWFLWYLLLASVFYAEFKNIIARVAQIKELMGERAWKVTPRTSDAG